MKKRLLLINVVDTESYTGKEGVLPTRRFKTWQPLQLGIIAKLTPDDWNIEIIDENFEQHSFRNVDLVGLSSFTMSINRAYSIADVYRRMNIPVVLGGVHATLFPVEAQKYVDIVAVGRAEGLWQNILCDFDNKTLKPVYYSNENGSINFELNRYVFSKYEYPLASIASSAGCRNNCDYCSTPYIYNHKYYERAIEEVIKDILECGQSLFIFTDEDFFGFTEAQHLRVENLLKKMIALKIKKKWMCFSSMHITKHANLLRLASRAGCVVVFAGAESYNEPELLEINKPLNIRHARSMYKTVLKSFHKNRIAVWGSFILGFSGDTADTIRTKAQTIRTLNFDNYALSYLTPLPKTKLFNEASARSLLNYSKFPEDWIYYNFTTPVIQSEKESENNLFKAFLGAFRIVYASYSGFIKNFGFRKFLNLLFSTRSFKCAVYATIIFAHWDSSNYKHPFFRWIFKFYGHSIKT